MPDKKTNYFIQHYQPIVAPPNQIQPGGRGPGVETEALSNNPSEYAPIQEYVEPELNIEMQQHMQATNIKFTPPPQIPLTPVTTPQMNIAPVVTQTLPLAELEIEKEMKTDVYTAIRWLAEWCIRQLKEVPYKDQDKDE
ncbi:MAG: hypothetical protein M3Q44_04180 [bacterium]|nr:hypothetical protein [bacterium]